MWVNASGRQAKLGHMDHRLLTVPGNKRFNFATGIIDEDGRLWSIGLVKYVTNIAVRHFVAGGEYSHCFRGSQTSPDLRCVSAHQRFSLRRDAP